MFVIKFMSGLVETVAGGEDQENYDPHNYRRIEQPTTYTDTMVHMLKGSIGAGILAMPEAVKRLGVTYSIIGLVIIGVFAAYCILLLISAQYQLCKRHKKGYMAYPKSMKVAILSGPPILRWTATFCYYFVDTVLILWQLGICCIYFVFVAENVKQVIGYYKIETSLRLIIFYELVPAILINLVKNLKLMTPMSTISNFVTVFGLLLVTFYLVEDDLQITPEKNELKGLENIPIYVGTALFALEAVGVILALEYNMEKPKQFRGCLGLFSLGMVVILSLYLLVGIFGYLKYGDDIQSSITLNLPEDQKKAQAAKLAFAFAIFLSFPLQNFVAYTIIWRRLKKIFSGTKQCVVDYMLRVILVVIPWFLAIAIPKLGPFIALFGALCLSLLALVFPGLMDLCVWYAEPVGYGPVKYRLLRDLAILAIGTLILISGVYTSILDLLEEA